MAAIIAAGFHFFLPREPLDWPTILSRLDGLWYLRIVRDGYFFSSGGQSSIAFAPLYPMLMRWLSPLFGHSNCSAVWAGVLISNLALLVALGWIVALTDRRFGGRAATRVGWYVLLCPGTIFLSTVYPMSLMLAVCATAIYAAEEKRWRIAGAVGMLAPLVRPDGVLLFFPLLVMAWQCRASKRQLSWLLLVPAGAGAWLIAQWLAFGTPLAFVEAQRAWEPSPLITVWHSDRAALILGMAAVFVLLTLVDLPKMPVGLTLYSVLFLGVMLTSGRLWSLPRFVVILFPCFMTLAWLGNRWKIVHVTYVTLAIMLAAIFTLRFGLGLWVA